MKIALMGNPNSGKTTLFNQLTGSRQHVGNFPGVTVEKKEGAIRAQKQLTLVDLPGLYSLSPYTAEEVVTRDFLIGEKPRVIINIVDATNLERNLYLTTQLMDVGLPVVIALNMMDEVRASGDVIDIKKLSAALGAVVVPISASRAEGIQDLVAQVLHVADIPTPALPKDLCTGAVHKAIHAISHIVEQQARQMKIPARYLAIKFIENDAPIMESVVLSPADRAVVDQLIANMEKELDTDRESAITDMRYSFIERVCAVAVQRASRGDKTNRSLAIDEILTHKHFALPIFLGIMLLVFFLTFAVIGPLLSNGFAYLIDLATTWIDATLTLLDINAAIHSLIMDGVCVGVGSVLSFLPTIVVLFFFLSLLEDSGYMARVAFVMDKLLRKIGLSGRSFVPMLIGFGCSVPAILSTRTLSSERDRRMTILLTPFMSCSAKLPIYATFSLAFFPNHTALVMGFLYVLGMVVGVLYGLLLKSTLFRGNPVPFVMELPTYRLPSATTVALHCWEKAKDFLTKAFTVIFLASIIIWVLQSFDARLMMVNDRADSLLSTIGRAVSPIFRPLGFDNWIASTALITGLTAKEAVVSTTAVLMGVGDIANLPQALSTLLTPLSALSFLVFTLLYMPCFAAMAAVKRELHSTWQALLAMTAQTGVAYLVAMLTYQIGRLFLGG